MKLADPIYLPDDGPIEPPVPDGPPPDPVLIPPID